jgi:predicted  nucleic acid-binding Zn-ribbon protein
MKHDLEEMLKLQAIDYDIDELERSKSYLPEMIEKLKSETQEIANLLKQTEEKIKQLNLDKKNWEIEVASWQGELERFQKQMRDIKTNKEYDALMAEIEVRKQKISQNEDLILQAMQELEEETPKIEEYKKKLEQISQNNQQQMGELQKQIDGVDIKIKIKLDEKRSVVTQINKVAFATYERIRKKCNPVVVAVRKKACGACYKTFPPQRIQEIKRGDGLITCDNCGRILIWTEDNGS